jgi:hypothetical protein
LAWLRIPKGFFGIIAGIHLTKNESSALPFPGIPRKYHEGVKGDYYSTDALS